MGYKRASDAYDVPQFTLENRRKKPRLGDLSCAGAGRKWLGRYETIFSWMLEKKSIVENIIIIIIISHYIDLREFEKLLDMDFSTGNKTLSFDEIPKKGAAIV